MTEYHGTFIETEHILHLSNEYFRHNSLETELILHLHNGTFAELILYL